MKRLYVGNLSFKANEDELRKAFAGADILLEEVTIIRDRESGQSRGFAFVQVLNDEEAQKAIAALNGCQIQGRPILVSEARTPQPGGASRAKAAGDG